MSRVLVVALFLTCQNLIAQTFIDSVFFGIPPEKNVTHTIHLLLQDPNFNSIEVDTLMALSSPPNWSYNVSSKVLSRPVFPCRANAINYSKYGFSITVDGKRLETCLRYRSQLSLSYRSKQGLLKDFAQSSSYFRARLKPAAEIGSRDEKGEVKGLEFQLTDQKYCPSLYIEIDKERKVMYIRYN